MSHTPQLAPPPPLRGSDPDSFARHTVTTRLPDLLRRTLDDTADAPVPVRNALRTLHADLPDGPIRPIEDPGAPDASNWRRYVEPHVSETWLTAPWFFVETYFYRRIVAATGYFDGAWPSVDPFRAQKDRGWTSDQSTIDDLATRLFDALDAAPVHVGDVEAMLAVALWGNRADLSMWPTSADGTSGPDDGRPDAHARSDEHILADDRTACARYLLDDAPRDRVDIVLDNAGRELTGDLALAVLLLDGGLADRVVLHAKLHPTFISDATPDDVRRTVDVLAASDAPATRRLGRRLQRHLDDGLDIIAPAFWTSPLPGWELPDALRDALTTSDLVVSKGDANYRRFLGDRHWPPTTPLHAIVSYVPTRFLALRTLKSEVAAGIPPEGVERARSVDSDWRVSGDWALAQFV